MTAMPKVGRPTIFSDELADEICQRIADGQSVREICKADDMPAMATIFRWLAEDDKKMFQEQYARAIEARSEYHADEIVDIADNGTNDWMERHNRDGESIGWAVNGEAVQRSKLRVETRKWLLAKLQPKKYGDKTALELTGKDGGPIEVTDARARLDDLVSRHAAAGDTPESSS